MDVIVKLTVPNYIYRFYRNASAHVDHSSPEALMADALSAYAGLLSPDIAKQRSEGKPQPGIEALGNSSRSKSRKG